MRYARLQERIEEGVAAHGVHLIDLVVRGEGRNTVIEVFIDAEDGVTTDACAEVSRNLTRVIEAEGSVRGTYRLVVSSPGISRPLRFPWQYRKHVGRRLLVRMRSPEGSVERAGRLIALDDHGLTIDTEKGGGEERVAFDAIVEAVVKAPW